ncbi:MAG: cytochrome P450 [Thermoanaerobaculia bacterium]|nr:cytochrome P450 [Thermoanaerobaculia bacterium]
MHLAFSPIARVPINLPGTPYHRLVELSARAEATVLREIANRRGQGSQGDDVLSMMIRAIDEGNVDISHNHLVGNAFTLFLAGHDVPANALGFILLLLAQHPSVAAALLDELDAALGGEAPSYDQVFKLPMLDRVVKESLRVLSPAVIIWRRITSPVTLGGYELPVGTEVILSPYMTHVDPAIYLEPKRFLPERWQEAKPSPFEYLPYSYGARKCLGAAFAEVMLRAITAMIVQRFRLELIAGTKVDLAVTMTMKPKGGLPVVVRRQDREFNRSRAELRGFLRRMVDFD